MRDCDSGQTPVVLPYARRRRGKRWISWFTRRRILLGGACLSFVLLWGAHYRIFNRFYCLDCVTLKHDRVYGLDFWFARFTIIPKIVTIEESGVYQDFFGPEHQHVWRCSNSSSRGPWFVACDSSSSLDHPNLWAADAIYPRLKEHIPRAIDEGWFNRAELLLFLSTDRRERESFSLKEKARYREIEVWFEETYANPP